MYCSNWNTFKNDHGREWYYGDLTGPQSSRVSPFTKTTIELQELLEFRTLGSNWTHGASREVLDKQSSQPIFMNFITSCISSNNPPLLIQSFGTKARSSLQRARVLCFVTWQVAKWPAQRLANSSLMVWTASNMNLKRQNSFYFFFNSYCIQTFKEISVRSLADHRDNKT